MATPKKSQKPRDEPTGGFQSCMRKWFIRFFFLGVFAAVAGFLDSIKVSD
jgi:hypothetical protein